MSSSRLGKVLITGAGGFIGSHLVEAALHCSSHIRAYVRYNSKGEWGWLERSPARAEIEVIAGDIRDYDSVSAAVQGCDTIFHLAALIGIPYSYTNPLAYIRTNVEGTYNVLQAARHHGASNVLVTSTSETYGSAQYCPMDESHPLAAQSPYAATKVAADQLALSFHKSFGMQVKVVRPFNTYGPRQSPRAIIPTIILQILGGIRELRLGNLSPTRDLTYVTDTAAGFLAIAHCSACAGSVTHIGTNSEISVQDILQKLASLLGVSVTAAVEEVRVRPGASEVVRLRCANSKLVSLTGWRPEHDLEGGLQKTVAWFQAHGNARRAEKYAI